jgi:hypothetical protein
MPLLSPASLSSQAGLDTIHYVDAAAAQVAGRKASTLVRLFVLVFGLMVVVSSGVAAQHLPIKTYMTADGLPVNLVKRIKRDSHGFLWFGTRDGLSKFDGYHFTNYGTTRPASSGHQRPDRVPQWNLLGGYQRRRGLQLQPGSARAR